MDREPGTAAVTGARGLASLADPTRVRILHEIRRAPDGRAMVSRLAETVGLRQPTVSHHMRVLLAEGIVTREQDGRRAWYGIAPGHEQRIAALLDAEATPTADPDLERIAGDLAARFRGILSPETVTRCVQESRDLLLASSSGPLLTSRISAFAASRLDAIVRAEGRRTGDRPDVLFVCVKNAGRSQMAAGILRHLAGDRVVVRTAGSAPAASLPSTIVAALDEIGVPVGGEFPKPLTDEAVRAADVVVTMGCGDACPVYAGRRYLDWELDDPAGLPLDAVRGIRDDIAMRVRALLSELLPAT
ncbi:metalloregulator ArsR/SmtB family transcription factor [Microbacter sp. GSS18]|nr:metalloregulator ArsR/SmtB family transcription factor [Microbacter sp. GSS18]